MGESLESRGNVFQRHCIRVKLWGKAMIIVQKRMS
jgi:hypothetical protein